MTFHKMQIGAAGDYLLDLLAAEEPVLYSQLYNEEPGTHKKLLRALGLDGQCNHAELLIDHAVQQLAGLGLVTTRPTGDLLIDGQPDYQIALTPAGRAVAADVDQQVDYQDVNTGGDTAPTIPWPSSGDCLASEPPKLPTWLVHFFANEDGFFKPLALVKALDEDDACRIAVAAGVKVTDDRAQIHARRLTRDANDGDGPRPPIECLECCRSVESDNNAFCPACLGRFMAGSIDDVRLIAK